METLPFYKCKRHFVTFMLFLGMANAYVMRTNLSVAIVAMVNHSAIHNPEETKSECGEEAVHELEAKDGPYNWDTKMQGWLLAAFFIGYVAVQIPVGIILKTYKATSILGYGMLINSMFAIFVPLGTRWAGPVGLFVVRLIQGLGESPIVPCTHALLAKWVPRNERSRAVAFTYAGAQFGTIISMPVSGFLAEHGFDGGWPSIFYIFGIISFVWSLAFLVWIKENPSMDSNINPQEREYIHDSLGDHDKQMVNVAIPIKQIFKNGPFYGILIAHMGHNYGYETLMTELPTYMKEVLHFSIISNGFYSSLPYCSMWIFSMLFSIIADWIILNEKMTHTNCRKLFNSIGQYGPAIALITASYTGCNRFLTLSILTIGVGLTGGIYSGFKVTHLDISPRFTGFLMALTNCTANMVGLLAPVITGHIIYENPTIAQWQKVFFISGGVYIFCGSMYNCLVSCELQPWNDPERET